MKVIVVILACYSTTIVDTSKNSETVREIMEAKFNAKPRLVLRVCFE